MKTKYKILIHAAYWIYIINQVLFPYYLDSTTKLNWREMVPYFLPSIFTFYGIYFLFPYVQNRKKKVEAGVLAAAIFTGMILIRHLLAVSLEGIMNPLMNLEKMYAEVFQKKWLLLDVRVTIIYTIYALLIRFAIGWFESQKIRNDLILQTRTSELALLRSQVNPHFLFNTLNNIYSLVYQKSENAPAAVMKLSSIMRYMLYDATTDKVLLEKEIEYLQSFIELQKLRIRDRDFVDLHISGVTEGRTIAPMLLIPFVENAFKHCSKTGERPGIKIMLDTDPKCIRFTVSNRVKNDPSANKDTVGGIGINNIRRRLNLLYPSKHVLHFSQSESFFIVDLIIYNQ